MFVPRYLASPHTAPILHNLGHTRLQVIGPMLSVQIYKIQFKFSSQVFVPWYPGFPSPKRASPSGWLRIFWLLGNWSPLGWIWTLEPVWSSDPLACFLDLGLWCPSAHLCLFYCTSIFVLALVPHSKIPYMLTSLGLAYTVCSLWT